MQYRMHAALLLMTLLVLYVRPLSAQERPYGQPFLEDRRTTPESINDLVHIKLDVRFDYKKRYLYGKEWISFHPHFYPTDSVRLDAKGMDIHGVSLVRSGNIIPLSFSYDSLHLAIHLDRMYRRSENYTLYIQYTAKPNELKGRKKNEKGLYFINPDSSEQGKPVQIWTEGEPESASVWFPTLDRPDQKATEEMIMTVPSKYVTLSNGRLASQKDNKDGTRTDTWMMDKPHSSYLFMMAVGDFRIYRDHWRDKEVCYYVEPAYAPYAKDMFGDTPEAIEFFSGILGVDFPWNKYAEIAVRDYVSGAMENTTAAVFGESSNGTRRELMDRYYNPGLEHELFHQWFGDYVTAESWSNLTLNESFADLGEILWLEHKYGQDVAGEHVYDGMKGYVDNPDNASQSIVNFHYNSIKETFTGATYQKGGRVLNMLRHYLGKEAFYEGLHGYLTENAYQSAEVPQLRLAMEKTSGRDLNWFFEQWYYRSGFPSLDLSYQWDSLAGKEIVYVHQLQDGAPFILPVYVDLYEDGVRQRYNACVYGKNDTLVFPGRSKPQWVNFDGDKILVAKKQDHKSMEEYVFQYFLGPLFADRAEAVEAAASQLDDKAAQGIILEALSDKYSGIRSRAIGILNRKNEDIRNIDAALRTPALTLLAKLAAKDSNTLVRAAALRTLIRLRDSAYLPLFRTALLSPSYEVEAAGLSGIGELTGEGSLPYARNFEKDSKGPLTLVIARVYGNFGGAEQWKYVYDCFVNGSLQDKIHLASNFSRFIGRIKDPALAQQGIYQLKLIAIKYKKDGAGSYISNFLATIKDQRTGLQDEASAQAAEEAMKEIEAAP